MKFINFIFIFFTWRSSPSLIGDVSSVRYAVSRTGLFFTCFWVVLSCSVFVKTHTHPFNGPFSGITEVIRYQKGKTNLDFTGARDSEWQWHQLGRMQVRTWPRSSYKKP